MILILGGSSFSGDSYVAHKVSQGFEVASFERNIDRDKAFSAVEKCQSEKLSRFQFNLNDDVEKIVDFVNESNVRTIVNYASQSMVAESWEKPEDWYQTNTMSLSRLVSGLQKNCEIEKFIQVTTPEVYGTTDGWVKENFNFRPNSPYAISRAAGDWHLLALQQNFKFPVIFTRASNVYGEHQQLYRIVPKVILAALSGRQVPLHGSGKSVRSFIHISDVNLALDKILSEGKIGGTYHISTNELISIHDLVVRIARKLDVEPEELIQFAPDRPGKDFAYKLDSSKIRTELGWEDRVTLDQGIDRTIKWVTKNLDLLRQMPSEYIHRR